MASNFLENLWDNLLSRQPELIKPAYKALNLQEQESVLAHLNRMSTDPDWHPEQRISAQTALKTLNEMKKWPQH